MYIDPQHPYEVQIEVTTKCNCMCPLCPRVDVDDKSKLSPDLPYNKDLDLSVYKKFIDQSNLSLIQFIPMYGDPLLHPSFIDMVSYASDVPQQIHTNGSMRDTKYFKSLADAMNKDSILVFSIDGLEDTNHLYRRGSVWNKIISNAQAFIQSGGRARWKFIVFDYNKHQVEQAKALANNMGFEQFLTAPNWGGNFTIEETIVKQQPAELVVYQKRKDDIKPAFEKINCEWLHQRKLYLSVFGHVLPCAYLYEEQQSLKSFLGGEIKDWFDRYNEDWNDLNTNDLAFILKHPFFTRDLERSWQNNPLRRCITSCGLQNKHYGNIEKTINSVDGKRRI